jgi:hypothetical protein
MRAEKITATRSAIEEVVGLLRAWGIILPQNRQRRQSQQPRGRVMMRGQIRIQLSPVHGGTFTKVRLSGILPSALPRNKLRHLISQMHLFSGYKVECVLSVAKETGGWCDEWSDLLTDMPLRDLEVRYRIANAPRPNSRSRPRRQR